MKQKVKNSGLLGDMPNMNNAVRIIKLWNDCRQVKTSFPLVLARHFFYKLHKKNIVSSNKVTIYGLKNIHTKGLLKIGMSYIGFMNCHDRTFLNIKGKIEFRDNFTIGKGCRFDIGRNAIAIFEGGYVNPNTIFVIMHGITVGRGCALSWGCQFIDEDFHSLGYSGESTSDSHKIVIGSHVWIGNNVTVLKGSVIPDGCVVAGGSVVNTRFHLKNALIAGTPARIIRENIEWE